MTASLLMAAVTDTGSAAPLRRRGLLRSGNDRVLTGTAGGLGHLLGVDPTLIRAAFIVLSFAAGAGMLVYLCLYVVSRSPAASGERGLRARHSGFRQALAIGSIVLGLLLLLRSWGWWPGDAVVWPLALAVFGATVIGLRGDSESRIGRSGSTAARAVVFGRISPVRVGVGALLVLGGMTAFLAVTGDFAPGSWFLVLRTMIVPVLVTVTGLSLIFGPWLWRIGQQLVQERRELIRSEERSEVAAHLHDSVLQTLALIQRTRNAQEMAALARAQERELRAWLYGRTGRIEEDTVEGAIEALAGRIEQLLQTSVEAVVVGDAPMDDRSRSFIQACGEAVANAAQHSGAAKVSLYVEIEPGEIVAYVRDQGTGFDPEAVTVDRRGIAESIVGRMGRNGGSAHISSVPEAGTEVHLRMPRRGP